MTDPERKPTSNSENLIQGIVVVPPGDEFYEHIRDITDRSPERVELLISRTKIGDALFDFEETRLFLRNIKHLPGYGSHVEIGFLTRFVHSKEKLLQDSGHYNNNKRGLIVQSVYNRIRADKYKDDHDLAFTNRSIYHDRSWDKKGDPDFRLPGYHLAVLDDDCRAVIRLGNLDEEKSKEQKIQEWKRTNGCPERGQLSNREYGPLYKDYQERLQEYERGLGDLINESIILDASRGIKIENQHQFNDFLHNFIEAYKITLEAVYEAEGLPIPNIEINFTIPQSVEIESNSPKVSASSSIEDVEKHSDSNGFVVTIKNPEALYELAGTLAMGCEEEIEDMYRRRGPPSSAYSTHDKTNVISNNKFQKHSDFPIEEEETKIIGNFDYRSGFGNRANGYEFGCSTTIRLSPNGQKEDFGYFSEKKLEMIAERLRKMGFKASGRTMTKGEIHAGENRLLIEFHGFEFLVWMGFPSRTMEESSDQLGFERIKQIKNGLLNETFNLEFLKQKLGSEQNFVALISIYAHVYKSLISAIYPNLKATIILGSSSNENNNIAHEDAGPSSDVSFIDIEGQESVVAEAKKLVQAIKNPELYQKRGVKIPKGILLYGPPGTGKTMLAKAIANESGARLMEISVADIGSRWHGESEKMMQEIFDTAKSGGKTILFFDEFDSLVPPRDDSYEVTRKIIAVFNQNMDGVRSSPNVTVVAATNRPEGVDLAAKRSGRFDKIIEVPLPDERGRIAIFKKHMEKAIRASAEPEGLFSSDLDFDKISRETNGFSGADLANLVNRILEDKLAAELEGKRWTPVNTDEVLDMAYKISIERTEKVEVSFGKK